MKTRPVDLTRLARPGETFPSARVAGAIKGSAAIASHGVEGMMVWGAFFLANANGDQAQADARIDELVRFIESIQARK